MRLGIEKGDRVVGRCRIFITKTCPYNIQRFFPEKKHENFIEKDLIFSIFSLKTYIVGTH